MTTEILAIDNSKLNSCGFKGETRLSRWVQKVERISAHHFRVAEYCKLFNKKTQMLHSQGLWFNKINNELSKS